MQTEVPPPLTASLEADAEAARSYWTQVAAAPAREFRERFLEVHAAAVYDAVTAAGARSLRVRELVYAVADRFPGLLPGEAEVTRERELLQKEKQGLEIDQGIFLAHVLADRLRGRHLMHAMQRPLPEAEAALEELQRTGGVDLGTARVDRRGRVGHITLQNHDHLNAEDDHSNGRLELAVDLVLLDPEIEVGVLRGGPAEHAKHAGRRIFGSGINLTHLYHGQIGFVEFLIERELGLNNKLYRGHSPVEFRVAEVEEGHEKPFLAAVESWAIGGACQWLLIMDHVIAERGAYFNVPARKEGIIPGAANLRLPRFVGDRLARQAIFFNRDFPADSPEGRLLCDQVVDSEEMDGAIEHAAAELTSAGRTSLVANRRMLRQAQETLDQHRLYMAVYAREQAYCLYSEALIGNLERNWNARQRTRRVPQ
ncbi:MAG TPA: enoyl-CoA hydratase/isomerase family protein [Candidatus Dormibacteraeota bacterium]